MTNRSADTSTYAVEVVFRVAGHRVGSDTAFAVDVPTRDTARFTTSAGSDGTTGPVGCHVTSVDRVRA